MKSEDESDFDDVVSDEDADKALRARILYDDELFEREWELHGPDLGPPERLPRRAGPITLDNPWGHKRHLSEEEVAAKERFKKKGKKRNPLMRGRY